MGCYPQHRLRVNSGSKSFSNREEVAVSVTLAVLIGAAVYVVAVACWIVVDYLLGKGDRG